MSGGGHSPMQQFEVHAKVPLSIAGLDISYTNASLWMSLTVLAIMAFFGLGLRRRALVPGRFQALTELSYEFVAGMLKDTVGVQGRQYFPFVFTLFIFILGCNLLGMLPYSFTVTSHIIVTFALALTVFIGVTVIGFMRHGLHYLKLFVPEGLPMWMAPLMVFIEIISYLARPVTLSVRLAANMMAGHTMLKVLAGFVLAMGWTLGWIPMVFLVVLSGFEIFVAVLQAYIFTILVCVYLNDAVHLH
ncbi:MAG: F0F1 ATP synthase subunit A [Hyphomicrobiales bacterium]|nr:F0F1 ATP synthase subunit A [Hyphomicrobiales bacterium]